MTKNLEKMRQKLEEKKSQRPAMNVSDILPGDPVSTNSEPAKETPKAASKQEAEPASVQQSYEYPWQAFNPTDKGKKAGQQSVSVDVNDFELAVLSYLQEIRDTSTRKEARRLLRPAIRKIAKMIEEEGPEEFQF